MRRPEERRRQRAVVDAFLAAAIAMEEEAAQRYEEFADAMELHNNVEVAQMFRKLAQSEARQCRSTI